jgi:hypothetical protein
MSCGGFYLLPFRSARVPMGMERGHDHSNDHVGVGYSEQSVWMQHHDLIQYATSSLSLSAPVKNEKKKRIFVSFP